MTHGGLNSVQEALYFGVPMIGFPLFGDQPLNIRLLADKNVVYTMSYKEINKNSLDKALHAVIYDPKYRYVLTMYSKSSNETQKINFWIQKIFNKIRFACLNIK